MTITRANAQKKGGKQDPSKVESVWVQKLNYGSLSNVNYYYLLSRKVNRKVVCKRSLLCFFYNINLDFSTHSLYYCVPSGHNQIFTFPWEIVDFDA
jgi:hypothetical protein